MLTKFRRTEDPKLNAEIASALEKLKDLDKTSKEYGELVENVSKLTKIKTESRSKPLISPDTALVVAANIFGILWVARYERTNVIKSRSAFGLVMRP